LDILSGKSHQLMQKEPLASAIKGEREPGAQISTASDLRSYTHTHLASYGHPVGTCKMGPRTDPAAVVDSFGQLYGTGNVFVADASIMPWIPRANTNLTCFLIGFHLAELLAVKLSRT
jgi:choline dehydrogenase